MTLCIELQPKQWVFHDTVEQVPIVLYGGSKGGGKSHGLRTIILKRALETPGRRGAIFRRTYDELEENHILPLFEEFPDLRQFYNQTKHILSLPNGSRIFFRYCKREIDADNYRGREYHDLGIEEAGDWTETMVRRLMGCNRSSVRGITPRCLLTANPGGIGHNWLKRLFITRQFKEGEKPQDYAFVKALVTDNPALLDNDPGYLDRLKAEPNKALRDAFLYGNWDIVAGAYFEVDRSIHMVKSFPIPDHWKRWAAYDYGFGHCAAWGAFTTDEDGGIYQTSEIVQARLHIPEQAAAFWKLPDAKRLARSVLAGRDCWIKRPDIFGEKNDPSPTIAEEFAKHGIFLTPANVDRKQGASRLREYLRHTTRDVTLPNGKIEKRREGPRLKWFDRCPISFDAITRMVHDPLDLEDVLKVDADQGDPYTGDDCFVAGTPILTEKGEVPIETLAPGVRVLTRNGYKPIVGIWNSGVSDVLRLTFSNSRELVGTANHPLWIGDRFVRMGDLKRGSECESRKSLSFMGSNFIGTRIHREGILDRITRLAEIGPAGVWELCTSKFGSPFTALFPRGGTFTIPMGIRSITRPTTWSALLLRSIASIIAENRSDLLNLEQILGQYVPWRTPGITLQLARHGIVRMPQEYFPTAVSERAPLRFTKETADTAVLRLIQLFLGAEHSARAAARSNREKMKQKTVSCAEKPFEGIGIVRQNAAPVFVEDISPAGKNLTFAIHVADCHEYFAAGVLVKNCYDMVRYATLIRAPLSKAVSKPKEDRYKRKPRTSPSSWTTA